MKTKKEKLIDWMGCILFISVGIYLTYWGLETLYDGGEGRLWLGGLTIGGGFGFFVSALTAEYK